MASPNIKLYSLPPNYQQATDNDVQSVQDDELLPAVAKQDALSAVLPMTGIKPFNNAACYPINTSLGLTSDTLGAIGIQTQVLDHNSPSTVLIGPSGAYAPQVFRGASLYPPSGYVIQTSAPGVFQSVQFLLPYPTGQMTLKYWQKSSLPTQNWALPSDNVYLAPNDAIGNVVVVGSGCVNGTYEGVPHQAVSYLTGTNNGLITFPTAANSITTINFWAKFTKARYFAGDHTNWIADHYRMHPDVFIGSTVYPGDNGTVNGTPVVMGSVPKWVDPGTYQVNYRDGYVQFPSDVDSVATPVQANYAYYTNIGNVQGQTMDNIGGWAYQAVSDAAFAGSHGKRWVNRNDRWVPTNVYVNGNQAGQPMTVVPYDVLTVKTS